MDCFQHQSFVSSCYFTKKHLNFMVGKCRKLAAQISTLHDKGGLTRLSSKKLADLLEIVAFVIDSRN